ncbi:MAG TPA: polysaccharide biosynthesis/export family protein [Bryobacteraceae bacterium]|nr:polysaccharide biosynthesis/export family protein [Bryobacteraceae bacterium]
MYARILVLALPAWAWAQVHPSLMEDAGRENLPSQMLGVDDLIAISVYDAPEFTRTVRVDPDGTVRLPLLKDGVQAAGLIPNELERRVTQALVDGEILVDPIVKITVVEYHSRPVAVMGAVHKPLTFQAVGTVTVLDALARAEGLTLEAGMEILVTHAGVTERIPVQKLLQEADPAVNFVLHGGEEIRVPEAGKIFVVGNVRKPGAFAVRDQEGQSVLKAVALSEGLSPYASKQAFVYRRDASGSRQEIPVELAKIMERKSTDVTLEAGDILYIPDNKGRRVTMNAIDRLTNFGTSTASGVLIWH